MTRATFFGLQFQLATLVCGCTDLRPQAWLDIEYDLSASASCCLFVHSHMYDQLSPRCGCDSAEASIVQSLIESMCIVNTSMMGLGSALRELWIVVAAHHWPVWWKMISDLVKERWSRILWRRGSSLCRSSNNTLPTPGTYALWLHQGQQVRQLPRSSSSYLRELPGQTPKSKWPGSPLK